jgi:hypothetical protein
VTEQEQRAQRLEDVLRRLRRTRRGETICLAEWEIKLVLEYIDELKRKVVNVEKNGNRN